MSAAAKQPGTETDGEPRHGTVQRDGLNAMFRKISALLVRSLRSDARLARFHLLRLALGIVVLLVLWATYQNMRFQAAPGRDFYTGLTVCNLIAITVAGATFFAMAISEEREEQTLPLLKMADIGPLPLLLGKWLPRMVTALLLLSIQIPFTLLAITMGGVSWSHIVATNWMLLGYLILVGNLGLLISVWNHHTGGAFAATAILLALFLLGGPILGGIMLAPRLRGVVWLLEPVQSFLSSLNPFLRVGRVFSNYGEGTFSLPFQVWMSLVLGGVFFVAAWLSFDYATSLEPSGKSFVMQLRDGWSALWNRPPRSPRLSAARRLEAAGGRPVSSQSSSRPRTPGRRRVWSTPIIYKDFHQVAGGPIVILTRVVGYGLVCVGSWLAIMAAGAPFQNDISRAISALGMITAFWSLWFLGIEATIIAARLYRSEIKDRTWATLSLLPRSVPQIAYAKLAGAAIGLIPALLFLVGGGVLALPEFDREFGNIRFTDVMAIVFFTLQILAGTQLAMFLSVALDFAAWPLAIAMAAFGMILETAMLVSCFLGLFDMRGASSDLFIFVSGSFIAVMLFVTFHVLTLVRLDAARASDG